MKAPIIVMILLLLGVPHTVFADDSTTSSEQSASAASHGDAQVTAGDTKNEKPSTDTKAEEDEEPDCD